MIEYFSLLLYMNENQPLYNMQLKTYILYTQQDDWIFRLISSITFWVPTS